MSRLPARLAIATALLSTIAVGGWVLLQRRGPAGLGRAAVLLPMVAPTRPAIFDPAGMTIGSRFAPPDGYARVPGEPGSYVHWLRSLPLKPDGAPVRLFNGARKARQDVHAAVLDLDPGARDLQQCADAAIRLRAEYLYAARRMDDISFHFTSGFPCSFSDWRTGHRVSVRGSDVRWLARGVADASTASLRRYLDVVFTYAGTASLPRDVESVDGGGPPEPGDIYLQPGSPGHAMTVVDIAARGDDRVMLLAQSYMPAQEIHIVRNPASEGASPWIRVGDGPALVTPEWRFPWTALRRFRAPR